MKKSQVLLVVTVILLILQTGCSDNFNPNKIIVKVILSKKYTEKLRGQYLYLYDCNERHFIDSVIVNNETAIFNLTTDSSFFPHEVSVKRNDTFNNHSYSRPMGFQNPYKANTIISYFYLDRGVTTIKAYYNEDSIHESFFRGSKQNEPFLKNIDLHYPDKYDAIKREQVIAKNISIIQQYPYAIYFLKELFYFKEYFLDEDLRKQLTYFNDDVKNTSMFKSFNDYFAISAIYDKGYPSTISLEDNLGIYQKLGNDKATYHLVVFWASWCGPCRKEIPELKEIYNNHKSKGLVISSISIDDEKINWINALEQEKMPWQQFIAIDSTRKLIDRFYNIKAIPKAYLFDKDKHLVEIFLGSNSTITNKIDSLFASNKILTSFSN